MNKSVARVICFLVFIFFCFVSPAFAKPLWEFEVPVILKNMPKQVKYVVIRWFVDTWDGKAVEGEKQIPVQADQNGNFSTVVKIVIQDTDIKDYKRVIWFAARLELSEVGFPSFPPNLPGIPWTKSKPGTKLVEKTLCPDIVTPL